MNIKNILVKSHPEQGRLETDAKLLKTSDVGNARPSKSIWAHCCIYIRKVGNARPAFSKRMGRLLYLH